LRPFFLSFDIGFPTILIFQLHDAAIGQM